MSNLELNVKKQPKEEKKINSEKGCVNPADGTPKKCLKVKVINCKKEAMLQEEKILLFILKIKIPKIDLKIPKIENYIQFNLKIGL